MDNKTILVGIKRFMSKKGKEYAILQTETPFSQREITGGCVGSRVEEQFVPEELFDKIDSLKIGKPIMFEYNIVGSKAYIADFHSMDK